MIVTLGHMVELDPTNVQATYFARACGVARFSYNWALTEWKRQYAAGGKPSEAALRRQLNAIKPTEFPWMAEVTKCAPQHAIMNLGDAFRRFFRKEAQYPTFKRKGVYDSFRADNGPADKLSSAVRFRGQSVVLPKVGAVRMKEALRYAGRVLSVVVSRVAGRWFASFAVEIDQQPPARENQAASTVGVDFGVNRLAVLSDGTVIDAPRALTNQLKKLRRLSRSLARKPKGSANRQRVQQCIARLHYRISCLRKDALHKLTSRLAKSFDTIVIEDLNVRGMLANRHLARAISDVGMHEARRQLKYKTKLYGSELVVADRWFPSSKLCSACGAKKSALTLAERTWVCAECGVVHDRDRNAAINLKMLAASSAVTAREGGEALVGGEADETTPCAARTELQPAEQV